MSNTIEIAYFFCWIPILLYSHLPTPGRVHFFSYAVSVNRVEQGRAGQGMAGQGRAGQGMAGQGRAWQGMAGHGMAGQGRAG